MFRICTPMPNRPLAIPFASLVWLACTSGLAAADPDNAPPEQPPASNPAAPPAASPGAPPSLTPAQPTTEPGTTTPAMVESVQPEMQQFEERIYRKGNLRLSIMCANTWATPDAGLSLTADGAPVGAQRLNGRWSSYTEVSPHGHVIDSGEVWLPTDVGYLLVPGRHHIQIDAPGCAPTAFDMDAYPDHTQHAEGRLEITDPSLMGPVGAPNGWGMMIGAWLGSIPSGTTTDFFHQTDTVNPIGTTAGFALSFSMERRHLVLATDLAFATSGTSGQVSDVASGGNQTQAFTGTRNLTTLQARVGGRLPLKVVALEAGSGVGVQTWIDSASFVGGNLTTLLPPSGINASFYMPVWASATIKPTCNWGVQVLGQYDVHPASTDSDSFELIGGLIYQPSASCSEPAGVRVSPT